MKVQTSVLVSGLAGSAGDVTAAKWKGRQYARTRVTPSNPDTPDQQLHRNAFTRCVTLFQGLTAAVKTFLDILGTDRQMSGFNVHGAANIHDERENHFTGVMPANKYCDPVAGLTVVTGLAAGGLTVTWTVGTWTTDDVPVILYRYKNPAGDEYATPWTLYNVGAVKMNAGTIEMTGLTAGKDTAVALFPNDVSALAYGGGMVAHATTHA